MDLIFSSIINPEFKKQFWDEIYGFETYVGGALDHKQLLDMPIYLRKYYIAKHNERMEKEKADHEASLKKKKRN